MRTLPAIARRQCGVFSTRQGRSIGWTAESFRHGVRSGRIIRLRPGAYQVADLDEVAPGLSVFEQARWRHAGPAIGAALTTPGAFASHSTAAVLYEIPLLFLPERACVCVPPWLTGDVPMVHLHRCSGLPRTEPVSLVHRTSVERTVVDLAREHGAAAGLVAADFALHTGLTAPEQLQSELDGCRRWPGVRAAREAIAFADGRSESVLETRSRLLMRQWGIPAPAPQVHIGNEWGAFVARVDFYWDEFGVVGEADGDLKYGGTDPTPLLEEKKRQGKLDDLELPVVRWGSADLGDFGAVAARLRRTFARAARTPRSQRRWTVLTPDFDLNFGVVKID